MWKCRWNSNVNSISTSVLTWVSQALPSSQGAFLKDALQATVYQDNTLLPLLKVDHGLSSFTSGGEGSGMGGRFLCSLISLKPQLERTEKSVSQLFFQKVQLVLLAYTVLLICIERKVYSGRENILKMRQNPHTALGEVAKSFPGFFFGERCTHKIHLGLHAWVCMVKHGHIRLEVKSWQWSSQWDFCQWF